MEKNKLNEEIIKYQKALGKNVSGSFLAAEVEKQFREIYDMKNIFISTGGSRAGILAAITALKSGTVLVARNCSKEVFDAISFNRRKVRYLYPKELIPETMIYGSINPEDVKEALSHHPDINAVILTSPTMEGIISDIETIADIVHKAGAVLIVDESMGAHFPFYEGFPVSAVYLGADVVIQNPSKTLPMPSQTGLVFVNTGLELTRKIQVALNSFLPSDVSDFLLSGLGYGLQWSYDNEKAFADFYYEMTEFHNRIRLMEGVTILKKGKDIFNLDPSRMALISDKMDGPDFAQFIKTEQNLQAEAFGPEHVIFGNTVMDGKEQLKKLYIALLVSTVNFRYRQPKELSAKQLEQISILTIQPLNREYRDFVYITPPGCPLIAPGEMFTKQRKEKIIELINKGLNVEIWERYFS